MTYRLPARSLCSLPITKPIASRPELRLYSLHRKVGKSYLRIRTAAYPLKTAFIVWGEVWGMNPSELSIRKVDLQCNEAR